MGEKDMTEKLLEDYNDVFADIVNVLLFKGKEIIRQEELEQTGTVSQYKADDSKLHEQERDIAKYWKKEKVRIALCGLENQTTVDQDMCLRAINYDGAAYRSQLLNKDSKDRYPVITLVLYFGLRRWTGPKTLYQTVAIPEGLKRYISNYRINVFEIAYLTEKQVKMFTSDFRIVADYFVQLRKNKDYIPPEQTIKHVDALLKFMAVMTGDNRYAEIPIQPEKGEVKMCKVLDQVEARGIEKGIEEGIKKGIEKGIETGNARRLVQSVEGAMNLFHASLDLACESAGATVEEYQKAKKLVEK